MPLVKFAASEKRRGEEEPRNEPSNFMVVDMDPATTSEHLTLRDQSFLEAALSFKDQVLELTWKARCRELSSGQTQTPVLDPSASTGLLGTAFMCLRSYESTGNKADLRFCVEIIDACANATRGSARDVTFLCGRGGIYALGAVVASYDEDKSRRDFFLRLFHELAQETALPVGPEEGGLGMSYDLLSGRAGFLWAALFINKHLGENTIPDQILTPIVDAVIAGGRAGAADNWACPLMYRFHGTRYWGAANGLAGILHVLLHFPLCEEDAEDVKGTLRYMMRNRFPQSGNYPSSEGNPRDKLVQWSHGATGMAITLTKASQVFPADRDFRDAAVEAGEVVWNNGLVKKLGLEDGVAGNAYAFLSLYRLTGEALYLERCKAFSCFLSHNAEAMVGSSTGHEHAYSLFRGIAGVVCLWLDLLQPEKSKFPGYEL